MKSKIDLYLIIGMAFCYALARVGAADKFLVIALFLLLVFVIRFAGHTITWIVTGR